MAEIGRKMSEEIKQDRVKAFENYAEALMLNQYVLSASRSISLDSLVKIVKDIHIMIGAPKKKTEEADEQPLEVMKLWLSGDEVDGLPMTPEMVEEELEASDGG